MSTLLERLLVSCPYSLARGYVAESLATPASSGESQVVRLEVPFGASGDSPGMAKEVLVTYGAGSDPRHFDQPWTIRWTPTGGGPYPDFAGTLTVRADETYRSCELELEGSYEPPLGAAGKIFDAVAGSRIATATAREFLRRLARSIEERYAREEREKTAARNASAS